MRATVGARIYDINVVNAGDTGEAVVLWTPAEITTAAWYDASDSGTITEESGLVSQWADKSGNDLHATRNTVALRPTYDSADKSVNFDEDRLNIADTVTAQAGIFVVRNANGSSGLNFVTPLFGERDLNASHIFLRTDSTYTISVDGASANTGDASINGGDLFPGDGSGTDIDVTDDGYSGFPPLRNVADIVYWQINVANVFNRIACLSDVAENDRNAKVDIHEIVLLGSTPSAATRQLLEGYLAHKYDIQSQLPSGHPYKSSPPTVA